MTTLTQLTALSPLDGRYHGKVDALRGYFSEFGLIRFRVLIEIEWLKALASQPDIPEIAPFSAATIAQLDALNKNFSEDDAAAIKHIEATTNHDVKAVEYWLRDKLPDTLTPTPDETTSHSTRLQRTAAESLVISRREREQMSRYAIQVR